MSVLYKKDNLNQSEIVYYHKSNISFPRHTHMNHCVVWIVTEGNICIEIENDRNIYQKGDSLMVLPNVSHALYPISDLYSMISICIYVEPQRETELDIIKRKITENPEKDFSLNEMSRLVYITPYHLIRKFEKEYGLTPHKFQIQCRIRKAQNLLERGKKVIEVAQETGFCDQSHFNKVFKKFVGFSPSQYCSMVQYF